MNEYNMGSTVSYSGFLNTLKTLPEGDKLLMSMNDGNHTAIIQNEEGDYTLMITTIPDGHDECDVIMNETFPSYMRALVEAVVIADVDHMGE